jgi:hypothetical protein
MARHQKMPNELAKFKALLEADAALSGAAKRLRVFTYVKSANQVERLRRDLAEQMAVVQDKAYLQARKP